MDTVRPGVRLSQDMHEKIRKYAYENHMSINQAIIMFIQRGLEVEEEKELETKTKTNRASCN